jgi:thioesterase domain-containing protein
LTDRGRSLPWYLQGLSVRTVYQLAEGDYRPARRLDAPAMLFRATQGEGADEPFANLFADPLLGWSPLVAAGLELVDAQGGHSSMLQEPHVGALADRLATWMSRALRTGAEVAS